MDSWASQKGYPVVTVKRDYENKKVTFEQVTTNPYLLHIILNQTTSRNISCF